MPEPMANDQNAVPVEPELHRNERMPKGVLQKNLKPMLYLGAALLVIVAAIFSGTARKSPTQQAGSGHDAPQPVLQDPTPPKILRAVLDGSGIWLQSCPHISNSLMCIQRSRHT